ncbi:MAG TPA: hypothetical protein VEV42_03405 [Pyrinomonadaceae bacterium]|nr:hypothetical protein [Pyrinomonadaceae bacterium]
MANTTNTKSDPSADAPSSNANLPKTNGCILSDVIEIPTPETRPLKCYAFDPSQGKFFGNEMTLNVKYEPLLPGPVGDRIAVIDYDGANKRFYTPVDLDHPKLLIRSGLNPSESDPRFHQQMVYAVASETIQNFEAALGRRIRWRRQERTPDADGNLPEGALPGDIYRLNLYPHAMISANAAYSPSAKGILFGYFRASTIEPGRNLPGQTVFTCLSHDIVVHEVTHAILDGIRTYFSEKTSPDVGAFHEAFADIVALFRHFSHKEALLDTIQKTGGQLYKSHLKSDVPLTEGNPVIQAEKIQDNPLIGLAQQFGEARGTGKALRSALSEIPDPKKMQDPTLEPHQRGALLVAAIFDAYFTVYLRHTADLFQLYRAGGNLQTNEVSGPFANLLAQAASKVANILFKICVRAIDYCPAVDITFGDYLRALITADRDNHPADPLGVRDALMHAFRLRGILPDDAQYFSEDSLCWSPVGEDEALPDFEGMVFGDPNGLTKKEKDTNGAVLREYARVNAEKLGFDPNGNFISVPSFHPAFRITPDGSMRIDMIVEMAQQADVYYDSNRKELGTFPMRSGSTLLITKPALDDQKHKWGYLRYLIRKRLTGDNGKKRQVRQRSFYLREGLLEGKDEKRFELDFNMLHSGF